MTGPLIIGLTGHAGAGKDSAALCLLASAWRSIAFADALRVEIAAAWRIDVRMLTERATKDTPMRALCVGQADHRDWLAFACARAGQAGARLPGRLRGGGGVVLAHDRVPRRLAISTAT